MPIAGSYTNPAQALQHAAVEASRQLQQDSRSWVAACGNDVEQFMGKLQEVSTAAGAIGLHTMSPLSMRSAHPCCWCAMLTSLPPPLLIPTGAGAACDSAAGDTMHSTCGSEPAAG